MCCIQAPGPVPSSNSFYNNYTPRCNLNILAMYRINITIEGVKFAFHHLIRLRKSESNYSMFSVSQWHKNRAALCNWSWWELGRGWAAALEAKSRWIGQMSALCVLLMCSKEFKPKTLELPWSQASTRQRIKRISCIMCCHRNRVSAVCLF